MLKPRLGEWMGGMMSGRVREHEEESHPSACPKLPAVCFLMLGTVICNHLPALKPLDMPSQGHATLYSQLPSPSRTLTVLGRTSSMCQDGQPREPSRVSATFSTAVCRSSSPSCCPRKEPLVQASKRRRISAPRHGKLAPRLNPRPPIVFGPSPLLRSPNLLPHRMMTALLQ